MHFEALTVICIPLIMSASGTMCLFAIVGLFVFFPCVSFMILKTKTPFITPIYYAIILLSACVHKHPFALHSTLFYIPAKCATQAREGGEKKMLNWETRIIINSWGTWGIYTASARPGSKWRLTCASTTLPDFLLQEMTQFSYQAATL